MKKGNRVYPFRASNDGRGRASSDALTLTLKDVKNKKFTVELTADDAWLDAEDRGVPGPRSTRIRLSMEPICWCSLSTGYYYSKPGSRLSGVGTLYHGQYDIYVHRRGPAHSKCRGTW